jgi:DNA-directed RNA polymerase subunit RPC12/RpoP
MAVDKANWEIEHQCPQCGAPVLLDEADRLLACPFCRTRLYLVTPDYFRYRIPAPEEQGKDMLYLPYWRLKGASFCVQGDEIRHRFIDTSILATDGAGLPRSLGLRPQTMKLKFASPGMTGRFLEASLTSQSVIPAIEASDPGGKTFHRAFIGEWISLVYAPTYCENGTLYDALLKRPLSTWPDEPPAAADVKPPNWQIKFIPTLCPGCGWDLQGEKDVLVLTCKNCDSAWKCSGEALTEVPFAVLRAAAKKEIVYMPFWRMKPRAEGIALNSYADLIRLANLPKAVNPAFASVPIYFWSPAFKVNPALFLRWSRQMTVYQPEGKTLATFAGASCYPVTLAGQEAVEGMKITLAEIMVDKRLMYPLLTNMRLSADEIMLVYHPFLVGPRELIHETMHLTLDRMALNYGAYM